MCEGYDVALICESGHVVNSSSRSKPARNSSHCTKCGSKTIDTCPSCKTPIRGRYSGPLLSTVMKKAPPYCPACGSLFPWTQEALEAAEELIRFNESLDDQEKDDLVSAIKEVTRDTPKARVAVEKVKHYGMKLGSVTVKALREIIVDVASETAKKSIGW